MPDMKTRAGRMKMYGRMARNSERLKKKQAKKKASAKYLLRDLKNSRAKRTQLSGRMANSRYRIGGPLDKARKARAKAK